jgi:serine/threonine-protein kinase
MRGAGLVVANLSEADLNGANLIRADLRGAKVTDEQLSRAKSLKGAIMPDGSTHP